MASRSLVIGASGFLGSHVTRALVAAGEDVRVLIRTTSSTRGIDGLDVERRYGDVFDTAAVRDAISGCDTVYYCVVDARPWLRDPAPMWRTNVDGLRSVLDIAAQAPLHRFVFTSSIGTIGRVRDGLATEQTAHNWLDEGGEYIRTRVAAENLLFDHCRDRGLPGVAMCVANTYGPGDWLPTPHGGLVAAAARGKLPFYVAGAQSEVVGVEDAARAMLLAGRVGRVGERYIVSERNMAARDVFRCACDAVGTTPPRVGVPLPVMSALGAAGEAAARIRGRDTRLTRISVRLMHIMSAMDHSKATRELGWQPRPATDAIAEAARFFRDRRRRDTTAAEEAS